MTPSPSSTTPSKSCMPPDAVDKTGTPSNIPSLQGPGATQEPLPSSDQEMLSRFASLFPPPTPSLSTSCGSAASPASPHVSALHRLPDSTVVNVTHSPSTTQSPTMDITSSACMHMLHVQLPFPVKPEMLTISANRGDKLRVIADAWQMQQEHHYEWLISFSPGDVDMTAVQAKLEQHGDLFIQVRRLARSPSNLVLS